MKKVLACFVLLLMVASVLVPVGIGYAKPKANLEVAAEELILWDDWTINPAKYTYQHNGRVQVKTVVTNLISQPIEFDMGDGSTVTVPAYGKVEHTYTVLLKGQTERITITRLAEGTGIRLQQALILKIEPKSDKKGGDL